VRPLPVPNGALLGAGGRSNERGMMLVPASRQGSFCAAGGDELPPLGGLGEGRGSVGFASTGRQTLELLGRQPDVVVSACLRRHQRGNAQPDAKAAEGPWALPRSSGVVAQLGLNGGGG